MQLCVILLHATTLEQVLVFRQFGAKEPSLRHPFPYSLSFTVIRHFGHLFAVGGVFTKFRWGVHADLPIKILLIGRSQIWFPVVRATLVENVAVDYVMNVTPGPAQCLRTVPIRSGNPGPRRTETRRWAPPPLSP